MNSKLNLIASLFVAAFSKDEIDSIEVHTLRALSRMAQITIHSDHIHIEATDEENDVAFRIAIHGAEENIQVIAISTDDVLFDCGDSDERKRTVVFAEATQALFFATSVISMCSIDVELLNEPISDVTDNYPDEDDCDEDEYEGDEDFGEVSPDEDEDEDVENSNTYSLASRKASFLQSEKQRRKEWFYCYSKRPSFNRMLDHFGVTKGMDMESTVAIIATIDIEEIIEFFDMWILDSDTSEVAWDDGFDLIAIVLNSVRFNAQDKKKTLIDRVKEWARK